VEVKLSFRGANDLGFTEIDYLKSKSATADLVGGEPGIHSHRRVKQWHFPS
jgi:hypothetical protein